MSVSRNSTIAFTVCGILAVTVACARKDAPAADTAAPAGTAATSGALETRPPNNSAIQASASGQTRAPALSASSVDVQTVATGFEAPWAFELLPDGRALLTERLGKLRIIDQQGKVSEPVAGLPAVFAEGQGGLLDIALDPGFATNRTIWWSYSEPRPDGAGTALARGVLTEDAGGARVQNVKVMFQQMPSSKTPAHFGSRIVFTPDGTQVYLTLGERASPENRVQSQDLASHYGKVVRLNIDGSVPSDNPFAQRSGAKPEIWSYGHRNVQAAALDPSGRLWTIEHGPRGGDELNKPEAGKNYGWPVIGYGIDYSGEKMHDVGAQEGMEQPVYYWDPVIAPSGMLFHSGKGASAWQGDVFVGGMSSMKLVRLKLEGDKVVGEEWLLADRGSRIRDVKEDANGAIWVIADGTEPALLKITPKS